MSTGTAGLPERGRSLCWREMCGLAVWIFTGFEFKTLLYSDRRGIINANALERAQKMWNHGIKIRKLGGMVR